MRINLQQVRRDKNLSMRDLADKSGISLKQIYLIENNKVDPKLSTMCQIAKAMNSTVCDLIDCETD